jgi:hypothetical protein
LVINSTAFGLYFCIAYPEAGQTSYDMIDHTFSHILLHDNSKVIYWAEICFVNSCIADGSTNCTV